jgi:hypothetical protein
MAPSRPKESEEDPLLNTKPSLARGKKGRDAGTVDNADADTTTTTRQALPWTRGAVALASLLVIGTSASALLNQHVANDVPEYFFSISVFLPFSGLILCGAHLPHGHCHFNPLYFTPVPPRCIHWHNTDPYVFLPFSGLILCGAHLPHALCCTHGPCHMRRLFVTPVPAHCSYSHTSQSQYLY